MDQVHQKVKRYRNDLKRHRNVYEGAETMPERLSMLQKHREYVLFQQRKWADHLSNLDNKITFYQNSISVKNEDQAGSADCFSD